MRGMHKVVHEGHCQPYLPPAKESHGTKDGVEGDQNETEFGFEDTWNAKTYESEKHSASDEAAHLRLLD